MHHYPAIGCVRPPAGVKIQRGIATSASPTTQLQRWHKSVRDCAVGVTSASPPEYRRCSATGVIELMVINASLLVGEGVCRADAGALQYTEKPACWPYLFPRDRRPKRHAPQTFCAAGVAARIPEGKEGVTSDIA